MSGKTPVMGDVRLPFKTILFGLTLSASAAAGTVVHNPIEKVQVRIASPTDGLVLQASTEVDKLVFRGPGAQEATVSLNETHDLALGLIVTAPAGDFDEVEIFFNGTVDFVIDHEIAQEHVSYSLSVDSVWVDLDDDHEFNAGSASLRVWLATPMWRLQDEVTVPVAGGELVLSAGEQDALEEIFQGVVWHIVDPN